jgi:hypothetical protein
MAASCLPSNGAETWGMCVSLVECRLLARFGAWRVVRPKPAIQSICCKTRLSRLANRDSVGWKGHQREQRMMGRRDKGQQCFYLFDLGPGF